MFADRLRRALTHSGRDRTWLAESLGVSASAITQLLSGKAKSMTAENCAEAALLLGVSGYWLATGKGGMLEHPSSQWRDVCLNLAIAMDKASRSNQYTAFTGRVDELVYALDTTIKKTPATLDH